jgi:H+/Cl- antiporter ClcA
LPLLAASVVAYLVSCLLMRTSIMTEKMARRGVHIRSDYAIGHVEPPAAQGPA